MCKFTQKSQYRERRMAAKKESQGYLQIVNSIKRGVFAPIYVLMGEEAFYIDRIQKMIEETALNEEERDFNLTVFYGMDCDMRDVVNTCRRYPVMSRSALCGQAIDVNHIGGLQQRGQHKSS